MADITAKMVKELREMTNAGVMACKNALVESDGDMEKAVDILREKGQMQAQKKALRIAAEGTVKLLVKENKAVIVEVNSETDFVAKNEKFQKFVDDVAESIMQSDAKDVEELKSAKWAGDPDMNLTVEEARVNLVATIGENISIRRFVKIETDGMIVPYLHGGGRIGVLVEAKAENSDASTEALKNVAMQIAALNPKYVSVDCIDSDYIAHEKEILTTQAKNDPANAKKPENIIEKMIEGRLKKEFKEICLHDQPYVKDDSLTVKKYLDSVGNIEIVNFVRFETGEGIEKKQENFADEVAKQMNM